MTALFYPRGLSSSSLIAQVLQQLDIKVTTNINDEADFGFHWNSRNENEVSPELILKGIPIFNAGCLNVKKDYIDKLFTEIFEYSSLIDPETYSGLCVKKGTEQATHSGKIITCPCKRELRERERNGVKHYDLYQRLINNEEPNGLLKEYRLTYCFGKLSLLVRYKIKENRFHPFFPDKQKIVYEPIVGCHIKNKDVANILKFCRHYSIDFADLDVLRDRDNGKIYIIDVNNIATSAMAFHSADKEKYMAEVCKYFLDGINKKIKVQVEQS